MRIEGMNRVIRIIRIIDEANTPHEVLEADCFQLSNRRLRSDVSDDVCGKRYIRYLLLKLDYLYQDHAQQMSFKTLSVEHVLPQNPSNKSQWVQDFTPDARDKWTDRLGNLILISEGSMTGACMGSGEGIDPRDSMTSIGSCTESNGNECMLKS